MAEGMSFSFPSLLFHEGRTYGQPEVVPISLPQVSTGLRSRLPGSFLRHEQVWLKAPPTERARQA